MGFESIKFIEIVITVFSTSLLTYILGVIRYKKEKKVELKIQYLIKAWFKLEKASNRNNSELNYLVEEAIAEIQLFGTEKQIMLARKFAENIRDKKSNSLLPLLSELRQDLRKELMLKQIDIESYTSCRFKTD